MPTGDKAINKRTNQQQGPTGYNYLFIISIDDYQHAPPLSIS